MKMGEKKQGILAIFLLLALLAAFTLGAAEEAAEPDADRARQLAEALLAEAIQEEPEVTALLQTLESEHAHLEGLENRLKTLDSLTRKIITDAKDMEVSLEEAAPLITDILRYTLVAEEDEYTKVTAETVEKLLDRGYALVKFRNAWTGDSYRGINAVFRTCDGVAFELQFHTPRSFEVKMYTHAWYEIMRSDDASDEEKTEAYQKQTEITLTIPIPEGAAELQYPLSN